MTIQEVYERYSHLDEVICDEKLREGNYLKSIIYDLWQAIKAEAMRERIEHA